MSELSTCDQAMAIRAVRLQIRKHRPDLGIQAERVRGCILAAVHHATAANLINESRELAALDARPLFESDREQLNRLLISIQRAVSQVGEDQYRGASRNGASSPPAG